MPQYTGIHSYGYFSKETTYGTPVVPAKDFGLMQTIGSDANGNNQDIYTLGSRALQQNEAGIYEHNGSMEFTIQHGRFLELLVASISNETTTGSDTVHSFNTPGNTNNFTLDYGENSTADSNQRLDGCLMTSGSISMALNRLLTFRGDFIGRIPTMSTSANATANSTLLPFSSYMASVKTGGIGTETALGNVQEFTINWNNNGKRIYGLGSRYPQDGQPMSQKVDFKFKMGFASNTEYQLFLGSTTPSAAATPTVPSIIFDVTNGVTLGSGLRRFFFNATKARYVQVGLASKLDDWVYADFAGAAIMTSGDYTLTFTDNIANY